MNAGHGRQFEGSKKSGGAPINFIVTDVMHARFIPFAMNATVFSASAAHGC
jgi:hypothetical protein